MLKIGEFSKVAQVSAKTLRYYDELGLFQPAWVDRHTGYRLYSLQQLPRLNRILVLKELGFSLIQIEQLLRDDQSLDELQRLMRLRRVELEHQVQAEQARLDRVAARLRLIDQEGRPPQYDVVVKQAPAGLVAGIRDTVSGRGEMMQLKAELHHYLAKHDLSPGPLSPFMAVYYDAEYQDLGADVEVAVQLKRPLREQERVMVHELPGLPTVATLVHHGELEGLPDAYRALVAWSRANGYRIGTTSREIYLQDAELVTGPEGPDRLSAVTELQLPVRHLSLSDTIGIKETQMETRIVEKPAFTVVGLPFTGYVSSSPYDDGENNNEIGKVWDEFNARAGEIQHRVEGTAYGLCFDMPTDQKPWYLAGAAVEKEGQVPDGMMSISVPAQKYAVFPCTLRTLGETYRYITEEWHEQSGHTHKPGPNFEYYDQELDPANPQEMKLSVYWPVK